MLCLSAIVYAAERQIYAKVLYLYQITIVSDFTFLQVAWNFVIDFAIGNKPGPGILSCKYHWCSENGSTLKLQC